MSTLSWLHISDLHFRASQSYDANIVLRALLRDIQERIKEDDLRPDLICYRPRSLIETGPFLAKLGDRPPKGNPDKRHRGHND